MARPIYAEAAQHPVTLGKQGNSGLWFDKFCNTWNVGPGGWSMSTHRDSDNPKFQWIESVSHSPVGEKEQLKESARRLMAITQARGGRTAVFTSESRFVTGLGRSHPVENGFAWHPTLGTPFLPGSSVKGMVRAWAKTEAEPGTEKAFRDRLLGNGEHAGTIAFLDAIPVTQVQLEADVMTPHYAGWSPDDPPGDWRSPTPIPFLTAAAGTSFLFGIIPCGRVKGTDLDAAWEWLTAALEWAGGGAKTALGYGRFTLDDVETDALTEQAPDDHPNQV